jgi:hypothetical protein
MFFHDEDKNIALRYSYNFLGDFVYQIQIPTNYYYLVFEEVIRSPRFNDLFNPNEFLTFTDDKEFALITFDALNPNHRKSISLSRWFSYLNLGSKGYKESKNPTEYQTALIDFSGQDLSLSFMKWVQVKFDDELFTERIINNITFQINIFAEITLKNKRSELLPQYTFDDTFMIYMYSNGLGLAGKYHNITTHNCDTSFQQFRFIVAVMEIIKELKKIKPVIT